MAEIHVSFSNPLGESRLWTIWDTGRDPNVPPVVYRDYLGAHETTDPLTLYSTEEGGYGKVRYQASDGPAYEAEVADGARIDMD